MIVWTLALEFPVPDKDDLPAEFIHTYKFYIGKSLHLGVYAWLAAYSSRLPIDGRYRWLMMFFLMSHAWGTGDVARASGEMVPSRRQAHRRWHRYPRHQHRRALTWRRWTNLIPLAA